MYNYRADRAREITHGADRSDARKSVARKHPRNLTYTMMTQYDKTIPLPYVLPPEHPDNILADVMARLNWKNLRVAETENTRMLLTFLTAGTRSRIPGRSASWCLHPK